MVRSNAGGGTCRCRLLKLTGRGERANLCGGFGLSRLGGEVGVVGGGEAHAAKRVGCTLFTPLATTLLLIDGVRAITQATRELVCSARRDAPHPRERRITSFIGAAMRNLIAFAVAMAGDRNGPRPGVALRVGPNGRMGAFGAGTRKGTAVRISVAAPGCISLSISSPGDSGRRSLLLSTGGPGIATVFSASSSVTTCVGTNGRVQVGLRVSGGSGRRLTKMRLVSSSAGTGTAAGTRKRTRLAMKMNRAVTVGRGNCRRKGFAMGRLYPVGSVRGPRLIELLLIKRSPMCRVTSGVPRFPKNVVTYLRCLTHGVGCPMVTRGRKTRNGMVMRVIVRGSNSMSRMDVMHDVAPRLSTRTTQIMGSVPG